MQILVGAAVAFTGLGYDFRPIEPRFSKKLVGGQVRSPKFDNPAGITSSESRANSCIPQGRRPESSVRDRPSSRDIRIPALPHNLG